MANNSRDAGGWGGRRGFWLTLLCLVAVLALLFPASFHPDRVIFSNDGPLGLTSSQAFDFRELLTGGWQDLNWLGFNMGAVSPNITAGLMLTLGPVYYAKFYAPLSMLILGLAAWLFLRQLGFGAAACGLGALAAALNMNIFSNVCWGLGSRALTIAMGFLALAALTTRATRQFWLKAMLAGLAVGMAVMEGADNGALLSFYIAAFVLWQAWLESGAPALRVGRGVARVALVALLAGFMATQAIITLIGVGVKGVSGAAPEERDRTEQWDWATQWSLPKIEMLRVIIPGLFGYRMDTPGGGNYWGTVGQQPGWEQHRMGFSRHSGAGEYAGVLVILVAALAIAQSCRRNGGPFTPLERKWIWFWAAAAGISLLLAFGRHAPFYRLIYALPYFSTMRNPMKYMHFFHLAAIILFAFGVQGLVRGYWQAAGAAAGALAKGKAVVVPAARGWWKGQPFEAKWNRACLVLVGLSLLGALIYLKARPAVEGYLRSTGFEDPTLAGQIFSFSLGEVGMFLVLLIAAVALVGLILRGKFAGPRSRWAVALMGLFVIADLARANRPWILAVDYKHKLGSNPVVDLMRVKPYERRVSLPPFGVQGEAGQMQNLLAQLYQIEWTQHVFPHFNIQALEVTQLSRKPLDYVEYEDRTFGPLALSKEPRLRARHWELTNTRYLLGLAGLASFFNDMAPGQFRIVTNFMLDYKPGVTRPRTLEDFTAVPRPDGPLALIDFTGVLPRARLYTQWQISTNDEVTLRTLSGSVLLRTNDLANFPALLARLRSPAEPACAFLWSQFSAQAVGVLTNAAATLQQQQTALVDELNTLLQRVPLYEPQRFAGVSLSEATRTLLARNPQGQARDRLNRLLLQDLFPSELAKTPADLTFNPAQTVLVADEVAPPQAAGTPPPAGTVEITSYAPKRVELAAKTEAPAVLLLNDRFDRFEPAWKVSVDGREARMLRCNYAMRGVQLEPGAHTVVFSFEPAIRGFHTTRAALALAVALLAALVVLARRERVAEPPATVSKPA
jgi:hypothetical protein